MITLYHYTCEHGRRSIGRRGFVMPLAGHDAEAARAIERGNHAWMGQVVWFTDMELPVRNALGLTSTMLRCDRLKYRYRVTDISDVTSWLIIRRSIAPRTDIYELERKRGALPAHWYIAQVPVPVVLAPYRAAAMLDAR